MLRRGNVIVEVTGGRTKVIVVLLWRSSRVVLAGRVMLSRGSLVVNVTGVGTSLVLSRLIEVRQGVRQGVERLPWRCSVVVELAGDRAQGRRFRLVEGVVTDVTLWVLGWRIEEGSNGTL